MIRIFYNKKSISPEIDNRISWVRKGGITEGWASETTLGYTGSSTYETRWCGMCDMGLYSWTALALRFGFKISTVFLTKITTFAANGPYHRLTPSEEDYLFHQNILYDHEADGTKCVNAVLHNLRNTYLFKVLEEGIGTWIIWYSKLKMMITYQAWVGWRINSQNKKYYSHDHTFNITVPSLFVHWYAKKAYQGTSLKSIYL